MLRDGSQRGLLSARGEHRVLRVARTIADLDGSGRVRAATSARRSRCAQSRVSGQPGGMSSDGQTSRAEAACARLPASQLAAVDAERAAGLLRARPRAPARAARAPRRELLQALAGRRAARAERRYERFDAGELRSDPRRADDLPPPSRLSARARQPGGAPHACARRRTRRARGAHDGAGGRDPRQHGHPATTAWRWPGASHAGWRERRHGRGRPLRRHRRRGASRAHSTLAAAAWP